MDIKKKVLSLDIIKAQKKIVMAFKKTLTIVCIAIKELTFYLI